MTSAVGQRGAPVFVVGAVLLTLAAVPSCAPAAQPPPPVTSPSPSAAPATSPPPAAPPPPVAAASPRSRRPSPTSSPMRSPRTDCPAQSSRSGTRERSCSARRSVTASWTGEPVSDGTPAPAEPMTEDTMFDLASMTKSLATAPSVLQLSEQGLLRIDDPVQTYLPDFNPHDDPRRARVTLRMLLTHTSGIAGDLSLDGPWGLDRADEAEGIHRALNAWVVFEPGELFHYSDINFDQPGAIVEKLTGQSVDTYARDHVFTPLGMRDTRYLPAAKACGPHRIRGRDRADRRHPVGGDRPGLGR